MRKGEQHMRKNISRRQSVPFWIQVSCLVLLGICALALAFIAYVTINSGAHKGLPVIDGSTGQSNASESTALGATDVVGTIPLEQHNLEEPIVQNVPISRVLTSVDGLIMVRATTGSCQEPGVVEFSGDSGQSWITSDAFSTTGATKILSIIPENRSLIYMVALDSTCTPQLYSTTNLGGTWTGPLPVDDTWFFDPSNPTFINTPLGAGTLNCPAVAVSTTGTSALALCADGSIESSQNSGITWEIVPGVSNAVAVGPSDSGFAIALSDSATCSGLQLASLSEAMELEETSCLPAEENANFIDEANIALSQTGDSILVWSGTRLTASIDGETSWF